MRALKAMGSAPAAWHLNEGHAALWCCSAFVISSAWRIIRHRAREVRRTTIFTTHTPVPAGHDAFPFHLVETHLANAWGTLGDTGTRSWRSVITTTAVDRYST